VYGWVVKSAVQHSYKSSCLCAMSPVTAWAEGHLFAGVGQAAFLGTTFPIFCSELDVGQRIDGMTVQATCAWCSKRVNRWKTPARSLGSKHTLQKRC
jgi:hypothetical protein